MKYNLQKGENSNYLVTLNIPRLLFERKKEEIAKNVKSVEKNHEESVELKISLETFEFFIHKGTMLVVEENQSIKFIGNIYDLKKPESNDESVTIKYHIDIYPEVLERNSGWKKLKIKKINYQATEEELEETIENLRRQYASYSSVNTVEQNTILSVKCVAIDSNQKAISETSSIVELSQTSPNFSLHFIGKRKGEIIDLKYDEKILPRQLIFQTENKVILLRISIEEINKISLPEFTSTNVKKLFGNEEVKTAEDLKLQIANAIEPQKFVAKLQENIDYYLSEASSFLEIIIPRTLWMEEVKSRMLSLEQRVGKKIDDYFDEISDDEGQKLKNDIRESAYESLKKFFILRFIVKEYSIEDVDWQKENSVEIRLYEHLTEVIDQSIKNKIQSNSNELIKKKKTNIGSFKSNANQIEEQKETNSTDTAKTKKFEIDTKYYLFNFKEFINELKDLNKEYIDEYENVVEVISGTVEEQTWYKEYFDDFDFPVVEFNKPINLVNNFDWRILTKLIVISSNVDWSIEEIDDIIELNISSRKWNIEGYVSDLSGNSINKLFEKIIEENIVDQIKISKGKKELSKRKFEQITDWLREVAKVRERIDKKETNAILNNNATSKNHNSKKFSIPKDISTDESFTSTDNEELVDLIIKSHSLMKSSVIQYTLNLLSSLTTVQKNKLREILKREIMS